MIRTIAPSLVAVFLAIALLGHVAVAVDYNVHVILPYTGATAADVDMYTKATTAAELAATEISGNWTGDRLLLQTFDSQNKGPKTLQFALQSAQDATVLAVIGAGPDTLTESCAQLLFNFGLPMISPFTKTAVESGLTNFFSSATPHGYQASLIAAIMQRYGWTQYGIAWTPEASSVSLKNAILAQSGIAPIATLELAYGSKSYLETFQVMTNVSTNIYIMIVPDSTTLRSITAQTQISGGFYQGPKAFLYLNSAPSVASSLPQGSLMFNETEGRPVDVASFAAKIGATPTKGATTAYDTVIAIGHAIERLKSASTAVTRANLLTELVNTNEQGYSGPLSFGSNRYRSASTYNITNIATTTPARTFRTAFTWDGALHSGAPILWPSSASTPTPGNVTLYPVAFISSMFANYTTMLANGLVVPLNTTAHQSFVRYVVRSVNALLPIHAQLSTPPLNDNGTVSGAVRVSTSTTPTTYIAMVASWDSANSKIIQGVLSAYGVPQLSYSAGDPTLSSKELYPTFVRINPSDAKQVSAVVDMIQYFGWNKVGVITSTSSYGQLLDAAFSAAIANRPISRAATAFLAEDGSDLQSPWKTMKDAGVNIVLLFVEPSFYVSMRISMNEVGYTPRAVIITGRFFQSLLWDFKLVDSGISMADFKGWIGVTPAGGFEQEAFANLTAAVMSQSSTTYPSMKEGFLQSPEYCAYIYDSFRVIADAVARCLADGRSPRTSGVLMNYIRQTDLDLTTGRVQFDDSFDRLENNYVARYVASDGSTVEFGTWSEATAFISRSAVVWPNGASIVPIAEDPKHVRWLFWNSAGGIVLAVLAGIGLLLVAALLVLCFIWHSSPILISSTYSFLIVMLVGAGLGFGSMFTWIGEPRAWICALRIWLPPIAFVLMLAPLLAKTWRLHRIFTLSSLKVTSIPLWKLVAMVALMVFVQVGICIAWISAGTIQPALVADTQHSQNVYKICNQNQANRVCSYVTYGYLGLLMVFGAYYAFRVRNLPKDFNESRWIGFSLYNTLLFSVIIVILGYSLSEFKVTVLILICVCTLAITFGVLALMMGPKIWDLILHPDKRSTSGAGSSPGTSRRTIMSTRPASEAELHDSSSPSGRRHDYTRQSSNGSYSPKASPAVSAGKREVSPRGSK